MNYLKTVVLGGVISRVTILLFVLAVGLFVPVYREGKRMNAPCLAYRKAHPVEVPRADPSVGFSPCTPEPTAIAEIVAGAWFLASMGCLLSLLLDLLSWIRRRQRSRRGEIVRR